MAGLHHERRHQHKRQPTSQLGFLHHTCGENPYSGHQITPKTSNVRGAHLAKAQLGKFDLVLGLTQQAYARQMAVKPDFADAMETRSLEL